MNRGQRLIHDVGQAIAVSHCLAARAGVENICTVNWADAEPRTRELVRLAWDVHNGTGGARVARLFEYLEPADLVWVGNLFVAIAEGPESLAHWLEASGVRHG